MKAAVAHAPNALTLAPARGRLADYVELIRPRIAVLVLFTVGIGGLLASGGTPDWALLLHTILGTGLVASGASALNQLIERQSDGRMTRTESRPLPAGRLQPLEVLVFGSLLTGGGLLYLASAAGHPWAALVAVFTFASYVFIYTPLKSRTTLNTLVGAVPGALPPVIGWVALRGRIDAEAIVLFLIVFLWQLPHFLAIAWIYRDQYGRAGLRMLPVLDATGRRTGRRMVAYCSLLILVSLLPVLFGWSGSVYLLGAVLLGIGFLGSTVEFAAQASEASARRVLRASLVYLPALFLLLLLDGVSASVVRALSP
jgi:protoheme IX farnesyltransferase